MGNIPRRKQISTVDGPSLFSPPKLLPGEDADAYNLLLTRVQAEVGPLDVIEEVLVDDVVSLTWDVQRWRRVKSQLLRARGLEMLEGFLRREINREDPGEKFKLLLEEILRGHVPEDEAKKLTTQYAEGRRSAIDKINKLLAGGSAEDDPAESIVRRFAQNDPGAVRAVNELLGAHGMTLDDLLVDGLFSGQGEYFSRVEQIERLITAAEARRNTILRELEWHRATLGKTMRRTVEKIEGSGLRLIEAEPATRKAAR